jgi:hypothetical protein
VKHREKNKNGVRIEVEWSREQGSGEVWSIEKWRKEEYREMEKRGV